MKSCITFHCENNSDQGGFVGDLCVPCHSFITTGRGKYSQIYRNTSAPDLLEVLQWIADADGGSLTVENGVVWSEEGTFYDIDNIIAKAKGD